MSYISTGLSLALNKTKICFADIDPDTGLISLESIKNKIKSIMPEIMIPLVSTEVEIKLMKDKVLKNK